MTKRIAVPEGIKGRAKAAFGVDAEEMFLVACRAHVIDHPELDAAELAMVHKAAEEMEVAGGPGLISGDVPTVLRVVTWMAHEGRNGNGLTFIKEELPAAAKRIAAPNLLVMDWNHSAVYQSDGQRIIGAWYKADYAFDPKAHDGKGAWGILTTGIMWAWANPDIATSMLAEQERNGHLDFSMACIPTSVEYGKDAQGVPTQIAHNPIFFTNSALDVAPADKAATGFGYEGSDNPNFESDAAAKLLAAAAASDTNHALSTASDAFGGLTATEEHDMEELKAQMTALLAELETEKAAHAETLRKLDELTATINAAAEVAAAEAAAREAAEAAEAEAAAAAAAEAAAAAAGGEVVKEGEGEGVNEGADEASKLPVEDASQTSETPDANKTASEADSLRLTNEALSTEIADLRAEYDAVVEKLQVAESAIAQIDANATAAARTAKLAERIASLPESVRRAYEARDEEKQLQLAELWLSKDDAAWTFYLTEELGVMATASSNRPSYLERSRKQGALPIGTTDGATDTMVERIKRLKK